MRLCALNPPSPVFTWAPRAHQEKDRTLPVHLIRVRLIEARCPGTECVFTLAIVRLLLLLLLLSFIRREKKNRQKQIEIQREDFMFERRDRCHHWKSMLAALIESMTNE